MVVADEDVVRLDVPVDHALTVGQREGLQHRLGDRQCGVGRHRATFAEQLTKCAAGDQLHDEEDEIAVRAFVRPLVEDVHQAGMVQSGDGTRLTLEPRPRGRVRGQRRVHDFGCEIAVEAGVDAVVDGRHAAMGDTRPDAVATVEQIAGLELCCHGGGIASWCVGDRRVPGDYTGEGG